MRKKLFTKWSNRELMAQRLRGRIEALGFKLGLDPVRLDQMAEQVGHLCVVCLQPFVEPHIYFWPAPDGSQIPRGIICGYCHRAVERCGNELEQLRKHKRFWHKLLVNRARLGRLIRLNVIEGPFDPPGELLDGEPDPSTRGTPGSTPEGRTRDRQAPEPDLPERSEAT